MFDIAWSELLLIAVIALIFIGPKELPHVLQGLGRAAAKLRRSADDFRRQFEDSMKEAGYEDLHKNIQDIRSLNPASQLKESIDRAIQQDYAAKPPLPSEQPAVQPSSIENVSSQHEDFGSIAGNPGDGISGGAAPHSSPDAPVSEGGAKPAYGPDAREAHALTAARPQTPVDEAINDRATPVA